MPEPAIPLEQIDADAQKVLRRLTRNGFQAYLVGGCVRDVLLARELHDIDIAVQGNAAQLARAFADAIGAAFYVMDETFDVARVILNETPGAETNSLDANGLTSGVNRTPTILVSDAKRVVIRSKRTR